MIRSTLRQSLIIVVAFLFLAVTLCIARPDSLFALSIEQKRIFESGILYLDLQPDSSACLRVASSAAGTPIDGVHIAAYSPQEGDNSIEGRPGLDGKALIRTLDDVRSGESKYVTLAGNPEYYDSTYTIPSITYVSYAANSSGENVTLTNVVGYVHDTRREFRGVAEGRYDIPVGRDYTNPQINSQPFVNHNSDGTAAEPKIQLLKSTKYEALNRVIDGAGTPTSSNQVTGPVYMLGDSITAGAQSEIEKELTLPANNLTVTRINAVNGRSIRGPGSGSETGLQAITNDAVEIEAAGIVVIALGTNPSGSDETGVRDMITAIRRKTTTARIFWVNVFSPGASIKDSFNRVLASLAPPSQLDFTVIDTTKANIEISPSDQQRLHPSSTGNETFAKTVVNGIKGTNTNANPTCGSLLSGKDAAEQAYNYFIDKGLSPVQAAGIVGNFHAESGVNPMKLQCIYSYDDGIKKGISPSLMNEDGSVSASNLLTAANQLLSSTAEAAVRCRGSSMRTLNGVGWGLVQWTSFTKITDTSRAAGKTDEEISTLAYQLDFLWAQLTGDSSSLGFEVQKDGQAADDFPNFKTKTSLEDTTIWFAQKYERCSACDDLGHLEPRLKFARELLNSAGVN